MRVSEALRGSNLPPAEAEILLSAVFSRNRAWLLAHPDGVLTHDQWIRFSACVERRRRGEPVAYITGEQEFHGRPFTVDRRVLIPRPATEGIVRRALQFLSDGIDTVDQVDEGIIVRAKKLKIDPSAGSGGKLKMSTVVDAGTGSGCIAVTLALECPDLRVIATDVSADALEVARMNAERHGVLDRVEFRQGNLLEPVDDLQEPFLLVSNPPYIPKNRRLMKDVADFEPHVALFGGEEGNEVMNRIISEAVRHPYCVGWVIEMTNRQSPRKTGRT